MDLHITDNRNINENLTHIRDKDISGETKEKYTISWHNLSVFVHQKVGFSVWKKSKFRNVKILNNVLQNDFVLVSGIVENGNLLAIIGPSGSGKTTLLGTIACRIKDMVYGEIRFNGAIMNRNIMIKCTAFLPQHDITMDSLTVSEHFDIMSKLKMDKQSSKIHRQRKIDKLIEEFGLGNCASTYLKHLSGGERKRVSLAVQLLTDPLVLFCDEPTTGLDSYSAEMVVITLKKLTLRGKIVLCSIHQPASQVFEKFDGVILMAPGGSVAYQGPVNDVLDYFTRLNMKCPPNYNIADFMISQVSANNTEQKMRVKMLCDTFLSSDEWKSIQRYIKSEQPSKQPILGVLRKLNTIKQPTAWTQFWCLIWRYNLDSWRNNLDHVLNFAGCLAIAFMLVSFYYKYTINSQTSIRDVQGLILLMVIETIFQYAYHVVITFENEMPILLREVNDGLYTAGPYYLCQVFSKMIYTIIEPMIYIAVIYYLTNVFSNISLIELVVPFCIITFMAIAYGMLLSAIFGKLNTIVPFSTSYEVMAMLQSGIHINLRTMPAGILQYVRYISIFYYATETVVLLEWNSVQYIPCIGAEKAKCISTGQQVLDFYGYKGSVLGNLLIMTGIGVTLHIIAFLIIWKRTKRQAAY